MKNTGARLFPIVLLALLAGLTFWLEQATQSGGGKREGRNRHDPDYVVDRFSVRKFGTDGRLLHSLAAEKMLHYPDDDSTSVISPKVTYHGTPPTYLSSDSAWLDKDGKHVRLDGNVAVTRAGIGDRPRVEIRTSVLHAFPDDEIARTDAPVTIAQGRSVISGKGLEVNNKTRITQLAGPVRGIIHSKRAPPANPNH